MLRLPWPRSPSFHHLSILLMKSSCCIHKNSNMKAFNVLWFFSLQSMLINQWSEPAAGRMKASISISWLMKLSEMRKLPNLEAICSSHLYLLFQVCSPFFVFRFIKRRYSMDYLKDKEYLSNQQRPPFFSPRLVLVLSVLESSID